MNRLGDLCGYAVLVAAFVSLVAAARADEIAVYAEINDTRPGNIAVTPDNRVIITQQPLDAPEFRVIEVLPDGSKRPFPTRDWSDGPEHGDVGIAATIGIASDSKGVVWILDMGSETSPPQLVAWDTRKDHLHRVIEIPASVTHPFSFLQDFAIDEARGKIYIADMTFTAPAEAMRPAFLVVDIASGETRRILERDPRLMPTDRDVIINGRLMGHTAEDGTETPWHLALNAISIDPGFAYVYFGTINGPEIFLIPASVLADDSLAETDIATRIEIYARKGPNDGFIVDGAGRVFSGDTEQHAITVSTRTGTEILAQDPLLLHWPDGFAFAPDGRLFVVANQLNTHPVLNGGADDSNHRYFILTLTP